MKASRLLERKSLLRNQLRQSLRKLSRSARKKKSEKIIQRLMKAPFFKAARHIMVYVALEDEVRTQELILKSLAQKKNVYIPYADRRRKKIKIYPIRHWPKDVKPGSYGILEPRTARKRPAKISRLDLIVVPGMGFDRRGGRLGRGGGYFDRFLAKTKRIRKVGLAFREQMVSKIPMTGHDIKIRRVITD